MELRTQWIEKSQRIAESFEKALEIGAEASEHFGGYVSLEEMRVVLKSHLKNWKSNRFEIVIVGEFSTGKSTFINALLGKEVLPSKVTPTTATINYIRHIDEGTGSEVAVVHFHDGKSVEVDFDSLDEYVTEMSKNIQVSNEVKHVDLFIDSPYLKDGVVLVDTPGLQALHPEHERITKEQIKKSNASILLFNMEQPGKRTEFMFLRDLADSIDRIFFIGNRLDGVPTDEIDDVVNVLENSLRDNEYQPIPENQAKLYPISAKQALKARDPRLKTKGWLDWTTEQLLEASRFVDFENRLENYLFEGDKAKDLMKAPFLAIQNFYDTLDAELKSILPYLDGDINEEQLSTEQIRLEEEIELRKMRLQNEVRKLKGIFQDEIINSEGQFNGKFDRIAEHVKEVIQEASSLEDLQESLEEQIENFNHDYESLMKKEIGYLADELRQKMEREIGYFDLEINAGELEVDGSLRKTVKVKTTKTVNSYSEIRSQVEKEYKKREEHLKEERANLNARIELQSELKYQRLLQEQKENQLDEQLSFQERLINHTNATRDEYGVIMKRRIWFDKKGFKKVDNEKYNQLVNDKREMIKQKHKAMDIERAKEAALQKGLSTTVSEYEDIEDFRRAQSAFQQEKDQAIIQKMSEHANATQRSLDKEKRKIVRELEVLFVEKRREYRSFIRKLDALKLAQDRIQDYIQAQDMVLFETRRRYDELKTLLEQTTEKRAKINVELKHLEELIQEQVSKNSLIQLELI